MTDTKPTLEEQMECANLEQRAEKAESELAAIRGKMMEPDEEMRKFARKLLALSTVKTEADAVMLFKAMSAVALKEGK